jgi:hypothetical protein
MNDQSGQEGAAATAALRRRLHRMGVSILAVGILAAAAAYFRAASDGDSGALGYEIVDGKAYPIMPGDSKSYERQMELVGGTTNVLAAEFSDWFAGLWHGRKLAFTLGTLSVGSSLACFFLSRHLVYIPPPEDKSGGGKA